MAFFSKFSAWLKSRKGRWILGIFAILMLVLSFRSCTGNGVLERTTFHIAKKTNWYPIQLSGKEDNLRGFIDELITEIVQDEKLKADIVTYRTGDLFKMLDNEEYDAILLALTVDAFLKERYAVSESIFVAGPVLVVSQGSKVTSLEQLKGRPIGVGKDSPISFKLASLHPDLMLITYDNIITALNDLETGSVAGVIMEAQLAYTYTQALFPGKVKVASEPLIDLGIRLIARKEPHGEMLIEHFNAGLAKQKEDGDYERLLKRWELVSPK
ncbi:MAG: transporter substrate-binding domain-containing protein [Parachlamydia sp.]|nr:transporter substrate-binding domain-containing protein [Parachlamydia sp.]